MSTATATASPPAAGLTFREVLRIDVIRRIWYAQLVSLFGDFLALFAVIAVVSFRMHGTPSQLTGIQIAYMLPMVFVGPVAGVFVDRWPLKPTLIASDLIRAVLALLLIVSTQVWHVYLVLGALSCVSAFFAPAPTVTTGAVVAAFGPAICYALDVVSFIASATLIGSVAIARAVTPQALESSSNRLHAIWRDMRTGTDFIVHHAALFFVVLSMAAGLFTIGCFAPLISIYVCDNLHANAGLF